MKLVLLALLCGGTGAWCQSSPAPSQVDPNQLFKMPQKFSEPAGFSPPAYDKQLTSNPLPHVTGLAPPPRPINPQIDPKIIVRPPWPARDTVKGRDMSSDQFPNLRFLPLHGGDPKPVAANDGDLLPRVSRAGGWVRR